MRHAPSMLRILTAALLIALLAPRAPAEQMDASPRVGQFTLAVRDLVTTKTYAVQYGDGVTTQALTFPPGPGARSHTFVYPALDARVLSVILARRDAVGVWTRVATQRVVLRDALTFQFDDQATIDQFIASTADVAQELGVEAGALLFRHRYALAKQRFRWLHERKADTEDKLALIEAEIQNMELLNAALRGPTP